MRSKLSHHWQIILIFVVAIVLRFWVISHNDIFFYYDQARDATVSRQIFEQKDIKILGPSVSGTNDSVYHGVLYYYVIAPVYTLSGGSPIAVSYYLAIIGSLAVFVVYELGIKVFRSKSVGLLAALLLAVSAISMHQDVWLSNPQLSSVFIPLTYLLIWNIFFAAKKTSVKEWMVLGLLIALDMQSALQSIVVWGSVFVAFIYRARQEKSVRFLNSRSLAALFMPFFVGISTMILAEVMMWRNGILSMSSLKLSEHSASIVGNLTESVRRYWGIKRMILSPLSSLWVTIAFIFPIVVYIRKAAAKQIIWIVLFAAAPLWLLVWHYRDPLHTFIGLETVMYLVFAAGLIEVMRIKVWGKAGSVLLLLLFIVVQLSGAAKWKAEGIQLYGIQKGALLSSELALINKTYEESAGEPFTISTLTSPYNIDTTWNYLYDWYGRSRYNFEPGFVGMDQTGYPGDSLLPNAPKPAHRHFTIIEPDTTLSDKQIAEFTVEQDKMAGAAQKTWQFGTLSLQERIVEPAAAK